MESNKPIKRITNVGLLNTFLLGKTYKKIMEFIVALQKSVQSKYKELTEFSEKFLSIVKMLEDLESLIKEYPPIKQEMRYGNKAFRSWHARVEEDYQNIISKILPIDLIKYSNELKPYFLDSFGSSMRIDYGTGHELNFLAFLLILYEIGFYNEEDFSSIVHYVFFQYLFLMRKLQMTYLLEPAGSHGVWGLDDYHFLPFIFGASELINHPEITPKSIFDDILMKDYADKYMYLNAIRYIKNVNN